MKKPAIVYNWWLDSGVTYNAYVTAYMARIVTLGYTMPDATRLNALNTFTTSISSILSKGDDFIVSALNDTSLSNAATLNLINPSIHQLTYVNSPTYGTNGVMGNGSTSYADLNYNPATSGVNYTLNSACRAFYVETIPTVGTTMEGTSTSNGRNSSVYNAVTNAVRINSGSNTLSTAVDTTGIGYKAIDRLDSTNVSYYNETTKSDRTQAAVPIQSEDQHLGNNGTLFSNTQFGFYFIGGHLTQAEHSLLRSSYLTYRTAIGL